MKTQKKTGCLEWVFVRFWSPLVFKGLDKGATSPAPHPKNPQISDQPAADPCRWPVVQMIAGVEESSESLQELHLALTRGSVKSWNLGDQKKVS